jgi:MFS family permease
LWSQRRNSCRSPGRDERRAFLFLGRLEDAADVVRRIGFVETAEHAAVATHAPSELRGSAFGLLAATQSFGNLAASAIAGALWTLVSPKAAFFFLAGTMLVSLAGLSLARDPRSLPA